MPIDAIAEGVGTAVSETAGRAIQRRQIDGLTEKIMRSKDSVQYMNELKASAVIGPLYKKVVSALSSSPMTYVAYVVASCPIATVGTDLSKTHEARKNAGWRPTDRLRADHGETGSNVSDSSRQSRGARILLTDCYQDMSEKEIRRLTKERMRALEEEAKSQGFDIFRQHGKWQGKKDPNSLLIVHDGIPRMNKAILSRLRDLAFKWGYICDQEAVFIKEPLTPQEIGMTFMTAAELEAEILDNDALYGDLEKEEIQRRIGMTQLLPGTSFTIAEYKWNWSFGGRHVSRSPDTIRHSTRTNLKRVVREVPYTRAKKVGWFDWIFDKKKGGSRLQRLQSKNMGLRHLLDLLTQRYIRETKQQIVEHLTPSRTHRTRWRIGSLYEEYGPRWRIREFRSDDVLIEHLPDPFSGTPIFPLAERLAERLGCVVIVEPMRNLGEHPTLDDDVKTFEGNLFGEEIGRDQFLVEPKKWDSPADFLESIGVDTSRPEEVLTEVTTRTEGSLLE